MTTKTIKAKKVTLRRIMNAVENDTQTGFCTGCGHEQDGCEPDARGYECEACGEMKVYGAEELLIMNVG